MTTKDKETKLTLRDPFPAHQISKLPKPTKQQTDDIKKDYKSGIRCTVCGGWHHPKVVHLDYVGHAALTDRLLDVDPNWNWEPFAVNEKGLPALDEEGGLWIKLTVNGVTRPGYGDAQGKTGGDAMKERIGDALRNAAMRFGAALDLWHKGDLHLEDEPEVTKKSNGKPTSDTGYKPEGEELVFMESVLDIVMSNKANPSYASEYVHEKANLDADQFAWLWDKIGETTISHGGKEYKYRKVLEKLHERTKEKEAA